MPSHLIACPACARHVRAHEPVCPFCAGALPVERPEPLAPAPGARLSRAAIFAFGAAVSLGGCTREASTSPSPPSMNPTPPTPVAPTPPPTPPVVAQPTPPTPPTPPVDPGAMSTRYGAPPVLLPPSHHVGAPMPRYGSPPLPDWV
jgi:hypothetical protein